MWTNKQRKKLLWKILARDSNKRRAFKAQTIGSNYCSRETQLLKSKLLIDEILTTAQGRPSYSLSIENNFDANGDE